MEVNRRSFLRSSTAAGASVVFGGTLVGARFYQQAHARSELSQTLISKAAPFLTEQAHEESQSIPKACGDDIRLLFHQACLNVPSFVITICSTEFQDRLEALESESAREFLFVVTFGEKVVPHSAVVRWVRTIASETSTTLRARWRRTGEELARAWTLSLSEFDRGVSADSFLADADETIRAGIEESRRLAYPLAGQTSLLSADEAELLDNVEQAAMLRVNVRDCGESDGKWVPAFLWNALANVFSFFRNSPLQDPAAARRAISGRMAQMGNRVGAEFESEIRRRLADLHTWQRQAVAVAAERRAVELIPRFI